MQTISEKTCRSCLKCADGEVLHSLFGDRTRALFELSSVAVNLEDDRPKNICDKCREIFVQWFWFRERVLGNDSYLTHCTAQERVVDVSSEDYIPFSVTNKESSEDVNNAADEQVDPPSSATAQSLDKAEGIVASDEKANDVVAGLSPIVAEVTDEKPKEVVVNGEMPELTVVSDEKFKETLTEETVISDKLREDDKMIATPITNAVQTQGETKEGVQAKLMEETVISDKPREDDKMIANAVQTQGETKQEVTRVNSAQIFEKEGSTVDKKNVVLKMPSAPEPPVISIRKHPRIEVDSSASSHTPAKKMKGPAKQPDPRDQLKAEMNRVNVFTCLFCHRSMRITKLAFYQHLVAVHNNKSYKVNKVLSDLGCLPNREQPNNYGPPQNYPSQIVFHCNKCDKPFAPISVFNSHLKGHGLPPFYIKNILARQIKDYHEQSSGEFEGGPNKFGHGPPPPPNLLQNRQNFQGPPNCANPNYYQHEEYVPVNYRLGPPDFHSNNANYQPRIQGFNPNNMIYQQKNQGFNPNLVYFQPNSKGPY